VLALEERPRPAPGDDTILIRVCATTVSSGDARIRASRMPRGFGLLGRLAFGIRRPRQPILGTELAGVVEAVGQRVTAWQPGDAVIAFPGTGMRCHAGFRTVGAGSAVVRKPDNLSFEEAASLCFGGTTALYFLRRAGLKAGERLLVIGAAGTVGSAMVQMARHAGAQVTGVAGPRSLDLVRALGAAAVIDRTSQGLAEWGGGYDVIADTVGASSFARCLPLLAEHGRYLAVAADLPGMLTRPAGTKRSIAGTAPERREDVQEVVRLAEAGVLRPVIDSVHGFAQLPEAHARVDTGRKRGSVVVTIG
jgi:NADPH:quinone reductase-like Zn-dependent oxidoreductase